MDAQTQAQLKQQLIRQEGLRLKAYRCPAGKLTIGYGHNLDAHGIPEWLRGRDWANVGITRQEALDLLDADIHACESDLLVYLPSLYRQLSDIRQAVLVNMTFNMGIGKVLEFKHTLAFIAAGDFERAANGMLASLWARQVGKRAIELAEQMRKGAWQ